MMKSSTSPNSIKSLKCKAFQQWVRSGSMVDDSFAHLYAECLVQQWQLHHPPTSHSLHSLADFFRWLDVRGAWALMAVSLPQRQQLQNIGSPPFCSESILTKFGKERTTWRQIIQFYRQCVDPSRLVPTRDIVKFFSCFDTTTLRLLYRQVTRHH